MNRLLDFFFPPHCLLCGSDHRLLSGSYICQPCFYDLPVNSHSCQRCGVPLKEYASPVELAMCGQCLAVPPGFDSCWSPFIYAQPLEWVIRRFKFNASLAFAPMLANLMIQQMPAALRDGCKADAIIPMPLHNKRLRQRGFNQSLLLAKPIAKALGLKIDRGCCQRVKDTAHQTGKNARQRQQNIKGAFKFNNINNYKHLIIIDDVVTTGASVAELSRTLKLSGVSRVDVWSLARAEKN